MDLVRSKNVQHRPHSFYFYLFLYIHTYFILIMDLICHAPNSPNSQSIKGQPKIFIQPFHLFISHQQINRSIIMIYKLLYNLECISSLCKQIGQYFHWMLSILVLIYFLFITSEEEMHNFLWFGSVSSLPIPNQLENPIFHSKPNNDYCKNSWQNRRKIILQCL